MLRVPYDELRLTLERAMMALGLTPDRAALSARLTAEADFDGIRTHGLSRFPRFAEMVRCGTVKPLAQAHCEKSFGALERWEGNSGPGNLNAHAAMQRATELASQHGLGAVALRHTNHWQRGGTFGWQAAEKGCAAICWTNTLANLPPWGATTPAVGNNPLVIALPAKHGSAHVVLDMAMSQYSYGTLAQYSGRKQPLPFAGGFDTAGVLTQDAAAIEASQRALPVGLWKGSGLAFALDVLAALLSDGLATNDIPLDPLLETGQSQVFIAFGPQVLESARDVLTEAVSALHSATPVEPGMPVRYPGERVLADREANLRDGVPIDEPAWAFTKRLAGL